MGDTFLRGRRLRKNDAIRSMVRETTLTPDDFISPVFIMEENGQEEIASMPGYYRYSLELAIKEIKELHLLGLKAILLFVKVPESKKDNEGREAINPDGLMQQAVRAIKAQVPDICIMTDVALDPYSQYGHDGIVTDNKVDNDSTIDLLAEMSVSHAEAGTDFVAPSDMMDGRVLKIRQALEDAGYTGTGIMSYSAKYASCFYGPFRDALDSAPAFGDKKAYQMDPSNAKEAIKEALADETEGADIIMVKPALAYLDIISKVRDHVRVPVAAYNVSGEYAMIKAAAANGWIDENKAIIESLTAIKRAGADLIATYFAKDVIKILNS